MHCSESLHSSIIIYLIIYFPYNVDPVRSNVKNGQPTICWIGRTYCPTNNLGLFLTLNVCTLICHYTVIRGLLKTFQSVVLPQPMFLELRQIQLRLCQMCSCILPCLLHEVHVLQIFTTTRYNQVNQLTKIGRASNMLAGEKVSTNNQ